MHSLSVSKTIAGTGERFRTGNASERSFSSVLIYVEFQVLTPLELLLAVLANLAGIILLLLAIRYCPENKWVALVNRRTKMFVKSSHS